MSQPPALRIEGARQNNLKNVSLEIPHDRLTVVTGVSGSGKSSLAFDTLFAEGQWRYIESLSTYARMFLERIDRPDVDRVEQIRPAVALEQKNPVRTARSTVGTATEIYDYLRLLYAKIGRVHCPACGADPDFAVISKDGRRHLSCHRCRAQWPWSWRRTTSFIGSSHCPIVSSPSEISTRMRRRSRSRPPSGPRR